MIRQFRYDPYGTISGADDGDSRLSNAYPPAPLESWHVFQGLMYDPARAYTAP